MQYFVTNCNVTLLLLIVLIEVFIVYVSFKREIRESRSSEVLFYARNVSSYISITPSIIEQYGYLISYIIRTYDIVYSYKEIKR